MKIGFVQSASKVVTGVNNTTLAFGANVTAGNMLTASQASWRATAHTITTPTDTLGHGYAPMDSEQARDDVRLRSFRVPNCDGGADTVTFDISETATGELTVAIGEFSDTSGALNTSNKGTGSSAAPSSGDVTPTVPNCLLYAAMTDSTNNVALTKEASWTLMEQDVPVGSVPLSVIFKIQTAPVTEDADWTAGSAVGWVAHVAAFQEAFMATILMAQACL